MSQAPRRINTDRSLNRPTEQRPSQNSAPKPTPGGQPDFFSEQPEVKPASPRPEMPDKPVSVFDGGNGGNKPPRHAAAHAAPPPGEKRRRKKKKKTPLWLPMAITLAVIAVISGVVVYGVNMVNKVEESLRPDSQVEQIT